MKNQALRVTGLMIVFVTGMSFGSFATDTDKEKGSRNTKECIKDAEKEYSSAKEGGATEAEAREAAGKELTSCMKNG